MKRRLLLSWLACAWLMAGAPAHAAQPTTEIRPFVAGSLADIKARLTGQPFILALWSLTCTHCPHELDQLGKLAKRHPGLKIVLVSTDEPESAPDIAATLARHGLAGAEAWVFADPIPERLRQSVDPRWRGELPRSYLFDRHSQSRPVIGVPDPRTLEDWAMEQRSTQGR